jgi:hypothetical protein
MMSIFPSPLLPTYTLPGANVDATPNSVTTPLLSIIAVLFVGTSEGVQFPGSVQFPLLTFHIT